MKTNKKTTELVNLLEQFLHGDDRSTAIADRIEQYLLAHYSDDSEMKTLILALAAYSPYGGDYLYDEASLARVINEALFVLRERCKQPG